jgi:chemotaxis protein CheC
MTKKNTQVNEEFLEAVEVVASEGFQKAASGFSKMIGLTLDVTQPKVVLKPFKDIPMLLGGPENDAVGIYLRMEGDLSGHVMLIIPFEKSLEIVDMLMDQPVGTTKVLGQMERSALAEVGNLTGTFFLNAIADITGTETRPSPPAVMVDMVSAILDVIVAMIGDIGDKVVMFQTKFSCGDRSTQADFWVIPDAGTLEKMTSEVNEDNG